MLTAPMTPYEPRPSDCRRDDRRRESGAADWSDTRPACFRSEAFAEDLLDLPEHPGPNPAAAAIRITGRAWRAGRATLPLFGLALNTTLGWLGR